MKTPLDFSHPVEIAPHIWWVGHVLQNDPFQCHVYLIENGEHSVLIDPGSKLTWTESRKKILEIIPLEHIKYIVCHHQDPDITLAVTDLLEEIGTKDRSVITHWRTRELLEHYDWNIEFYEVQEKAWQLDANGRKLKFVFTPYMHFPGAICTYDIETNTLFSSDIFGALTEKFSLFAEGTESYYEQMKPFHAHYMPAREIVNYGLDQIEKVGPIGMIAPQHGSIIKKPFIQPIIEKLRGLECGLYIEFGGTRRIELISKVNSVLPEVFETAAFFDDFQTDARRILSSLSKVFPITRIFVIANIEKEHFIKLDTNSGTVMPCRKNFDEIEERFSHILHDQMREVVKSETIDCLEDEKNREVYCFPIVDYDRSVIGIGMFIFTKQFEYDDEIVEMLQKFEIPINVITKREIEVFQIEREKKAVYKMAITDNLTKLYNRYYLEEISKLDLTRAKRYGYPVSFVFLDIDFFKKINDTFGHDIGDLVLKHFADKLLQNIRESDSAFRYGGEEFLIMMPHTTKEEALSTIERLQSKLSQVGGLTIGREQIVYTFSAGITDTEESGFELEQLLKNADNKLYSAKRNGRNRIVI
jgi:diguanylate cyclase (GGDEF)-like protein